MLKLIQKHIIIITIIGFLVGVVGGIAVGKYEDKNPDALKAIKNMGKTTKQEWMNNMIKMVPPLLCMNENVRDCNKESVIELTKTCLAKWESELPEYFDEKIGQAWGTRIGYCIDMNNVDSFVDLTRQVSFN